ncbi:MAG: universal stress protein [Adhaeribacter sp.]
MDTILCPTDFSASSENAVLYADEVAARMNMRLVLFHNIAAPVTRELVGPEAAQPSAGWQNPALEQERKTKLEALKKVLEMKAGEAAAPYTTLMRYGQLLESIPEVARQQQASLLVLGNEGVESLKEVFVGSVAAGLIPQSPCPVLIVPPHATFKPLNKIVFAADLGNEPFAEVDWVLRLAALFDAEILCVHVMAQANASSRLYADKELHRKYKALAYPKISFHQEENPHVEEGLSQFCRRHKADLLVMGYHPKSFWQHLFAQDYTQEMAYHAYLPLLVIHYRN